MIRVGTFFFTHKWLASAIVERTRFLICSQILNGKQNKEHSFQEIISSLLQGLIIQSKHFLTILLNILPKTILLTI